MKREILPPVFARLFCHRQEGQDTGTGKDRRKTFSGKEKHMKNKAKIRLLTALMALVMVLPLFGMSVRAEGLSARERPLGISMAAKNGIVTESGKKYFYVNGVRKTGKIQAGQNWYYFGPEMKYGLIRDAGTGLMYYAGKDGILQTGWKTIGGKRYYFWASTYPGHQKYEAAFGMRTIRGIWHLFTRDGVLLCGLHKVDGRTYYTNALGRLQSGWQTADGKLHYFWPAQGEGHGRFQMASGTVVIDGVPHYLDGDGNPLKVHEGKQLDRYGAVKTASSAAASALDAKFYGDVSAGETPAQKAILSCLNYYEAQLQKLNRDNRFEELCRKKGQAPKSVWQYSNKSPLGSFFAPFDKMNGGAYSYNGRTVRYCNCDSCKWWVVEDLMHTNKTTSRDIHTVWKKYTVKGIKLKDLYQKGSFTVRENGKNVTVRLLPGTCFYNILPDGRCNHTWIYMGPDKDGTERIFDTGHGGVHSDPKKKDRVRAWEKDLSGRYHTDGSRAIFRTWVNEMTDTRDYADKTIGTIWVPNNLKTFYYRNAGGRLVKF
jgi:hypothetical protein